MTKGRAALPATVVAGKAFFIPLGGPTAHDFSGRDDNSIAGIKPGYRGDGFSFVWSQAIQRRLIGYSVEVFGESLGKDAGTIGRTRE